LWLKANAFPNGKTKNYFGLNLSLGMILTIFEGKSQVSFHESAVDQIEGKIFYYDYQLKRMIEYLRMDESMKN
jgi:hypothetical protein